MNDISKLTPRKAQVFLVDLALTVAGLALLALGARAVWHENLGLAGTALTAGLVLLFSSTIHRFESLKGLGIEAKTRELNRTIDKAEVTLVQMKRLAELVGTSLVKHDSEMGRLGGAPSVLDAYALSREVKALLSDIGSDEKTIRAALAPWARAAAVDLFLNRRDQFNAHFEQLRDDLDRRRTTEQSVGEQMALLRRVEALRAYQGPTLDTMATWDLDSFGVKLREHVRGSPEQPDAHVIAQMEADMRDAEVEFTALANTLDVADINYWKKLNIR